MMWLTNTLKGLLSRLQSMCTAVPDLFKYLFIRLFTRPHKAKMFSHNMRTFFFNIPWIVKINQRTNSTEADALRFLHSTGLDIPIPRLIFSCVHRGATYTVMSIIPGDNMWLAYFHYPLTPEVVNCVAGEVALVLKKLDTLRQSPSDAGKVMMSHSGAGLPDPMQFFEPLAGPFPSVLDLWAHMARCIDVEELREQVDGGTLEIMNAEPIRYIHPDLRLYNIVIRDGHLSGIIDWEDSGWFPSSWQVHTMRWPRGGCMGSWRAHWLNYQFSKEAEAAYEASKTFLTFSPV